MTDDKTIKTKEDTVLEEKEEKGVFRNAKGAHVNLSGKIRGVVTWA